MKNKTTYGTTHTYMHRERQKKNIERERERDDLTWNGVIFDSCDTLFLVRQNSGPPWVACEMAGM